MADKNQFISLTEQLVNGLLREAIGYRVEYTIPYFQGIVGYMVNAPMLWIRHSRFPILFIAYDQRNPDLLGNVIKQLELAKATEFFALLVVVPARDGTGNEAEELRHSIANSVYRYDFVVLDRQHLASIIAQGSSQRLVEIILEQGIELSNLSPYVVKGPVSEGMFFGREKEIKTISQTVQTTDYAVVGGRRIGKSSILQRINRLLNNDPRYRSIYINCEEKFNYEDLLRVLEDEFGKSLGSHEPLSFRKLASRLRVDSTPRQVVFLLDEVDELLAFDAGAKPVGQLFKMFRALSHEGVCRFVFSGSRTLYQHLHKPQSPFFNFCQDILLKPLEEKSITEIVSKPLHQLGIKLPQEEMLIDRIIDLTSCHPSIAQWLCDRLVKSIAGRGIAIEDVEAIAAEGEFHTHYLETAWGEANALERLMSLLMEGPSFDCEQLFEALAGHGIINRMAIGEGLEILQLYSLLERQGTRYRFALSHFPEVARKSQNFSAQVDFLVSQVEV